MTSLQEQAIEIIRQMPDNRLIYLVRMLQDMNDLFKESEIPDSVQAYQALQKYRKPGLVDRDYKKELQEALEEKYAHID